MSPRLALSEMEFMYHLSIYHGGEKEGAEKLVAKNFYAGIKRKRIQA